MNVVPEGRRRAGDRAEVRDGLDLAVGERGTLLLPSRLLFALTRGPSLMWAGLPDAH